MRELWFHPGLHHAISTSHRRGHWFSRMVTLLSRSPHRLLIVCPAQARWTSLSYQRWYAVHCHDCHQSSSQCDVTHAAVNVMELAWEPEWQANSAVWVWEIGISHNLISMTPWSLSYVISRRSDNLCNDLFQLSRETLNHVIRKAVRCPDKL